MRRKHRKAVFALVDEERERQDRKWGPQAWPIKPDDERFNHSAFFEFAEMIAKANCERATEEGRVTWYEILTEEVAEFFNAKTPDEQFEELIQMIAVAVHVAEQLLEKNRTGAS